MKERNYDSSARQAQAGLTKERIIETANALFQEYGFEAVKIETIAQQAGVSIPTVYAQFQSKRGLLKAIIDRSLPVEQFDLLVERARSATCSVDHLKITASTARQIYDAEKTSVKSYQSSSLISPEFKAIEQEMERRRYQRLADTIHFISEKNALKEGLSSQIAHDILWAFTGRDLYRMFVIEQNWSSDFYEEWLAKLLIQNLLKGE